MNRAILIYWLACMIWIAGLCALIYFVGWWILPALVVAAITAWCIVLQRACRAVT